jgi:DNA-binding XRE family transcriptional regulator
MKSQVKLAQSKVNLTWHKKIAKNRGESWHKNMLAGRMDAELNPSVLRLVRLTKRINQSDLAKSLDISESTFGAIERSKRPVSAELASKISKVLGTPIGKIFKPNARKKYVAIIIKALSSAA